MIGSPTWPEAAIWIATVTALATIFCTLIWQLGRILTEHVRQESETARAMKLAERSQRSR